MVPLPTPGCRGTAGSDSPVSSCIYPPAAQGRQLETQGLQKIHSSDFPPNRDETSPASSRSAVEEKLQTILLPVIKALLCHRIDSSASSWMLSSFTLSYVNYNPKWSQIQNKFKLLGLNPNGPFWHHIILIFSISSTILHPKLKCLWGWPPFRELFDFDAVAYTDGMYFCIFQDTLG